MSNKSAIDVISVPKGGGAISGIGETFAPDLFTGTGNFTVPIEMPARRNGFQPKLSLVYSTGQGNSPFGLGWDMSIPGVARKTSKGVPRYDDARDVFTLSGTEDLVPVQREPEASWYRPRTESSFARIVHRHQPQTGEDYWEVRSRDGTVSRYGSRPPPDASSEWLDPAAVCNPARPSQRFAWKLSETKDPFGNRIEYGYERDPVRIDGPRRWDQVYLCEIRYVDFGDPADPSFLVTLRFHYEPRPDPFSQYRAGFEIRTIQRCTRIEVWTHPGRPIHARSYHFTYQDQLADDEGLPANGVSLLAEIGVEGLDPDRGTTQSLPSLQLGYGAFHPQNGRFDPVKGDDLPPASLGNPEYELVDLMSNGLPHIVEMNSSIRYWRNLGGGRFDSPRSMKEAPSGAALADPGVHMIDANGNGRADLLVSRQAMSGYYPLTSDGKWDKDSFQPYDVVPSVTFDDPEVRLVDLDGDGVTDALRSGASFECFFNRPGRGWDETRRVRRRRIDAFPNVSFSDPRVKLADMSGDGLTDIVMVHSRRVDYWPALGRGDYASRITMRNNPRFPRSFDPRRVLVGDVDGDGAANLVYVDHGRVVVWINQAGNAWSGPVDGAACSSCWEARITTRACPPVTAFPRPALHWRLRR